jgi:RNase P/RNase MRP subunit POP5
MKRVKRRYLSLQIDSEASLTQKDLTDIIWGALTKLYGEYGASLTNLSPIDFNAENKTAIIRTNLATLSMVRASIASITTIVCQQATVHVEAVSGTIKSLRQKPKKSL